MKIGVIELLGYPFNRTQPGRYIDHFFVRKQYAGIMPQAIAVWCRQLGHAPYYAAYYGWGDPKDHLPADLDIVFIATHTCLAPLAYGLARAFRRDGVRAVIGGPHAKAYPQDCLRYFDLVVHECDKSLIADIIAGHFDPPQVIASPRLLTDLPTVAERLPEIRVASFIKGRPFPGAFIPILTSLGCPYTCDFCTDWNNAYRPLPTDRLRADLDYVSQNFPGLKLGIFDPNFGVNFDQVLAEFERIPPKRRNPYAIQSSLRLLTPERLTRLRDTHCVAITPSLESWSAYGHKAGVGQAVNRAKLVEAVDRFSALKEYIAYLGVNFILGLDNDEGDEPFELTQEFLYQTPFVWPSVNIPMAFGGTPLYRAWLNEGRILKAMPFNFYEIPSLTVILKNYDPITYFQKMVDLYTLITSDEWLRRRLATTPHWLSQAVHYIRTLVARDRLRLMRATLTRLQTDPAFLAFHTGQADSLPDFYAQAYTRQLGKYIELAPLAESRPLLV